MHTYPRRRLALSIELIGEPNQLIGEVFATAKQFGTSRARALQRGCDHGAITGANQPSSGFDVGLRHAF